LLTGAEDGHRYRLIVEFIEAYRWEPPEIRAELLADAPPPTDQPRWDVFLAATASRLASQDGRPAPAWAAERSLRSFWFTADAADAPDPGTRPRAAAAFQRRRELPR
jgi:hypothetical protein